MTDTALYIIAFLAIHYYLFLFDIYRGLKKLSRNKAPAPSNASFQKVSIIIPFRNESANLAESLLSIENQDFPEDKFEVIYINDDSTDDSLKIINSVIKKSNIRVISVPHEYSLNQNKKRAIRYGIENSDGDIIVTTDADCIHPRNWLKTMISYMDKNTGFVSGPVIFSDDRSSFFKFQKIEFAGLVITGAGLIGSGKPIICNAANIAYRRKSYEEAGGFEYKHSLSSGDDELLMQKIKKETKWDIKFCMSREALVSTNPNKNLSEFYNQRKRWASKGLFYSDKGLILKLILIFFFYLSLPVQFAVGFIYPVFFVSLVLSFILKIIFEFLIMREGTKHLFHPGLLKNFFIAELFHIPYIIIAGISGAFGNYNWKDRQLKR